MGRCRRSRSPSFLSLPCSCVIRGCVPKKLLVYGCVCVGEECVGRFLPPFVDHPLTPPHSSAFSEEFRDARGFGWGTSQPPFDWKHLVTKKVRNKGLMRITAPLF